MGDLKKHSLLSGNQGPTSVEKNRRIIGASEKSILCFLEIRSTPPCGGKTVEHGGSENALFAFWKSGPPFGGERQGKNWGL